VTLTTHKYFYTNSKQLNRKNLRLFYVSLF